MRIGTQLTLKKQHILRLIALVLALLLPVAAVAEVAPVAFSQDRTSRNGLVRVRLTSLGNLTTITLNLKGDYSANDGQISLPAGTQVKVSSNSSTGQLTLSASGDSWNMGDYFTLNRSSSSSAATIAQAASSNPYPADFSFYASQKNGSYCLLPIAHIQIEDYLYGVLPYEMGNSAPLEALKAQAVAARTYTVRMMDNRSGNQYDVQDTTADQMYRGTPSGNGNCKAAVDATKGMVLKYGSRYAETYYSSSNGGQTESALNIWGGKGYDYLRVTDDPFDLASGSAKTKATTIYKDLAHGNNRQSLLTLLKQKAVACLKQNGYAATTANTSLILLDNLTLHTPKYAAPSKLYTKADFIMTVETVSGNGGSVRTSVIVTTDIFSELEGLLGMSLQSSSNEIWTLASNSAAYTLKAGRYGHGVGMSQYGAMEMAKQGYQYDAILGFYYPGCTNVKLNLSDDPMDDAGNSASPETPDNSTDSDGDRDNGESTTPEPPMTGIGYATVLANGYLNLRQSPSLSAPILGVALEGETVKVLSQETNWSFVEYNGKQAYAMRSLLSTVFQKDEEAEVAPPQETPSVKPPASTTNQAMIFSTTGLVNFRETPSLSGRVLMQLPHGAYLDVLGTQGAFTHVSYQGSQGYMMTAFLVFGNALGSQSPSVDTSSPETNVQPPQVDTQPPATETIPPLTPEMPENGYQSATVTTKQGSLNLRQQPYEYAAILTRIPQYASVEAQQFNANWCKVRYGGIEGYAMSSFLTFGDAPQTTPESSGNISLPQYSIGRAVVTTVSGSLNLRMAPTSSGAILRTIPRGATVDVYAIDGQWALVSYRDYNGYVMIAYLTMNTAGAGSPGETVPETTPPTEIQKPSQQPEQNTPTTPNASGLLQELPTGFVAVNDKMAVAGAGYAYFRLSPSLNDRTLYVIPANAQFPILACSDEWCIAVWENTIGYVSLSEVTLYDSEALQ